MGSIPWRGAWQSIPVFFPGESHGQKSLEGYSPQGRKESDTTEATLYTYMRSLDQVSNFGCSGIFFFFRINVYMYSICICMYESVKVLVDQSCLTLCDPIECSLPGSSVHGILRKEYWSGQPFLSLGFLPDQGI